MSINWRDLGLPKLDKPSIFNPNPDINLTEVDIPDEPEGDYNADMQ
jgi:hypothetical protein